MDALRLGGGRLAVNVVVVGVAPDRLRLWHPRHRAEVEVDGRKVFSGRATTVVVMNGQYLRGADLAPRGHPGDGTCEVQAYALPPAQRRLMRSRLASGSHLPHPAVTTARGRRVVVRWAGSQPLEVDGRPVGEATAIDVELFAGAYRLLV
jgi:diacylglycerol kinase family enzyme